MRGSKFRLTSNVTDELHVLIKLIKCQRNNSLNEINPFFFNGKSYWESSNHFSHKKTRQILKFHMLFGGENYIDALITKWKPYQPQESFIMFHSFLYWSTESKGNYVSKGKTNLIRAVEVSHSSPPPNESRVLMKTRAQANFLMCEFNPTLWEMSRMGQVKPAKKKLLNNLTQRTLSTISKSRVWVSQWMRLTSSTQSWGRTRKKSRKASKWKLLRKWKKFNEN